MKAGSKIQTKWEILTTGDSLVVPAASTLAYLLTQDEVQFVTGVAMEYEKRAEKSVKATEEAWTTSILAHKQLAKDLGVKKLACECFTASYDPLNLGLGYGRGTYMKIKCKIE